MNTCKRGLWVALAFALASGVASAAGVNVLGKPQLGTFATIQAAVDAADHDDVLIVDPGTYAGFTIDDKALTVISPAIGAVTVNGTSKVQNLTSNHNVALIGLKLNAVDGQSQKTNGLVLDGNLGNVRVQSCTLKGARYILSYNNWFLGSGAFVTASTRVIFVQSTLNGRDVGFNSGEPPIAGGDGLKATDSAIALYDCTLKGGRGSDESYPIGGKGGAACRLTNFGIYVSGSTLTGANGGGGDYIGCTQAGEGGDALVLDGAQAQLLDATLAAGFGNGFYSCTPGVNGQPIVNNGGVVNLLSGTRRKMTAAPSATDNSILTFTIHGEPGDKVWLLASKKPAFLFVSKYSAVVAIPSPWFTSMVPAGTIGASGTLNFNYAIGDVPGAGGGWIRHVQGFIRGPSGAFMTSPLQFLLLNV